MKKEKYNLAKALHTIFVGNSLTDTIVEIFKDLLKQTGLTADELHELACQDQTIGNLKYRILGFMAKKKIDSSHII